MTRLFAWVCLTFCLLLSFTPAASAQTLPLPSEQFEYRLEEIIIQCPRPPDFSGNSTPDFTVSYEYLNNGYTTSKSDDVYPYNPGGTNYCVVFTDAVRGNSNGSSISEETAEWVQAGIDFLKQSVEIGAKVYPLMLGIRIVSLIMYS